MKRRTVSMTDDALEALDRIAKENRSTVSGIAEAAVRVLAEGGPRGRRAPAQPLSRA
jgi:predicted transcriptional regulator